MVCKCVYLYQYKTLSVFQALHSKKFMEVVSLDMLMKTLM